MGSLFTLHQRPKTYTISDGASSVDVAIKPLTWAQTTDLTGARDRIHKVARERYDTEQRRADLRAQYTGRDPDGLINQLIDLERPTVASAADLSPNGNTDEGRAAATEKWVERRREALRALAPDQLIDILIDREIRQLVVVHGNNDYADLCLVRMIIDPITQRPLLSDNTQSDSYVRDLQARTRMELVSVWMSYMKEINESAVRAEAEATPFASSGDLPKPSADSLGATTENSSTSPDTS